jgi:hypothetical protein
MPKLPRVTTREIIAALDKEGLFIGSSEWK